MAHTSAAHRVIVTQVLLEPYLWVESPNTQASPQLMNCTTGLVAASAHCMPFLFLIRLDTCCAPPSLQSAALVGVGLLYEGSCHRLMAEILLQEVARRPKMPQGGFGSPGASNTSITTSTPAVSSDREGYALAAGLALGMVTLGRGDGAIGLSDLNLKDKLVHLMLGGAEGPAGPRACPGIHGVFGPGVLGHDPWLQVRREHGSQRACLA